MTPSKEQILMAIESILIGTLLRFDGSVIYMVIFFQKN